MSDYEDKPEEEEEEQEQEEDLPSLLSRVPPEALAEALRRQQPPGTVVQTLQSASFSGPLPPPTLLEHYERVSPGFAERIVSMAEKEQSHRHVTENRGMLGSIAAEKRGQWFAFLICTLVLGGSMFLVFRGHPIVGGFISGSTLVGLAYIFIRGRKKKDEEADD